VIEPDIDSEDIGRSYVPGIAEAEVILNRSDREWCSKWVVNAVEPAVRRNSSQDEQKYPKNHRRWFGNV
jgi:hypothetical protein